MIIDKTKKIHEQITPESWCSNGGTGRNKDTEEICSYCIWLWVYFYDPTNSSTRIDPILELLNFKTNQQLFAWNDHTKRTFKDVYDVLKVLDL